VPVRLEQPEFFLSNKPTKELVKEACIYFGVEYPDIIVAQSILETGHYHSDNCIKYNNLFGLYNSKRGQYYKFDAWWKSVIAYRDMIQYKLRENEDYYKFLTRIGYAEDPEYINKVKSIVKRNDKRRSE
jgi:flagellum-specific peptidoglycan hydrolase FlgJ